jgi:hypothetical protein
MIVDMDWTRINYLNYGDSLSTLSALHDILAGEFLAKQDLIKELRDSGKPNQFLLEIVKSYNGRKTRRINLEALRHDINQSVSFKNKYTEFGCRGFSYILHESIDLRDENLREDINLRIALMTDEKLFYPPRVRRYLRRNWLNHYVADGFPSICFALGKLTDEACFVFIMQSDLAYRKPASIRDHFRGWRKVLLKNVALVATRRCRIIYLPSAHDILKCCYPFRKPMATPKSWLMTYDGTAEDFQFSPVRLQEPVNIQVYRDLAPIFIKKFFKLDLTHERGLK